MRSRLPRTESLHQPAAGSPPFRQGRQRLLGCGVRRDTWVPPYKALLCRGRCLHRPGGTNFQVVRRAAGGQGRPPLRKRILRCVGEGLCPSRGRGNRRSAAGGRRSEAVSRKCPDWRTRQWPSVGWHDGGQKNPAPTEFYKKCLAVGDRKGRPYGGVTRSAVRWADVSIGPYEFLFSWGLHI